MVLFSFTVYSKHSNQSTQQKERAQKLKDEQKAIEAAKSTPDV
jgi:hypothetical protein